MISLVDVEFSYHPQKVLRGISFNINEGERIALMGSNGSGKSTLALLIKGLYRVESGEILVDENQAAKSPLGITGLVFQNPEDQLAAATVEREIAFGLENLGTPFEEIHCRVDNALNIFGLTKYRKHPPHLLSGGQMQKTALASVMVMSPKYLILDEPTSLLDPVSRNDFFSILKSQPKEIGILYITQIPSEALQFDRLIVLNDGTIFYDGKPEKFFTDEKAAAEVKIDLPLKYRMMKLFSDHTIIT